MFCMYLFPVLYGIEVAGALERVDFFFLINIYSVTV